MRLSRALALCAAVSVACAGRLVGDVYHDDGVAFRVGALPAAWQRQNVAAGALSYHHKDGGTISAHGSCERAEDVPLDVLTNHLLIGVESRFERSRRTLTLDGRAALRTRIDAELDGVPVALDLVVVKKDGCVYDLAMVASRAAFAARRPDFDHFVVAFAVERP